MAEGKPEGSKAPHGTSSGSYSGAPSTSSSTFFGTLWRQRKSLLISLVVTLLGFFLYYYVLLGEHSAAANNLLSRLEYSTLDARFLLRSRYQTPRPDPRIIIVDIDQRAQEVLGRWPF